VCVCVCVFTHLVFTILNFTAVKTRNIARVCKHACERMHFILWFLMFIKVTRIQFSLVIP
jgi:hypothetical protein